MSLHLGNLSSHIRRDELLRVFRRFGRCTLRVKDKYGFVIYEYPANAEEALRTLRGQKICGERITLSWSNRRPRPLQRHARGGRMNKPPRGRHYGRQDYSNRHLGSDAQDDNRKGFRPVDGSSGKLDSAELIDEATGHRLNNTECYVGVKHHDFVQNLPDEGGGFEANLLENDRWGEQVVGDELENEPDFDRYEPYCGDDGKEQEDIHTSNHLGGSPPLRNSQEKPKTNQIDQLTTECLHNSKSQKSCYICGEVGHRMRKCPQELKCLATRSRGQLFLDRDASLMRWHKSDREASTSRNHQRLLGHGDSPVEMLTHRVRKKEYQGKKRRENLTPERHESKKTRIPVSSSIHSDYVSRSRSWSRSGMSISGSRSQSRSKSVPSKNNFMASKSRSASSSSNPGPKNFKSSSRSSSPTSLPLPASHCQPLASSLNRVQTNEQNCVDCSGLEFRETSDQIEVFQKDDAFCDNSKLDMVKVGAQNGNSAAILNAEEHLTNNHYQKRGDVHNDSIAGDICEIEKSCIHQSGYSGHNTGNLSQKSSRRAREFTSDDFVGEGKLMQAKNLEMESSARIPAANSMNISSKEICMLLKNSGLEHRHENEMDLPPETFFGSARLWPWGIIYYRRLRKGPISKENYARRLAQNEEFGIVDKYIRSSSGWGELTDENP